MNAQVLEGYIHRLHHQTSTRRMVQWRGSSAKQKLSGRKSKLRRDITMQQEPYRHGDLLLWPIDYIPSQARPTTSNILQEGEATGHKHVLGRNAQILELEGQKYVQVEKPTKLTHEQHNTIILQRGKYLFEHERELDMLGEVRQVSD